jgi:hypothetical protein
MHLSDPSKLALVLTSRLIARAHAKISGFLCVLEGIGELEKLESSNTMISPSLWCSLCFNS